MRYQRAHPDATMRAFCGVTCCITLAMWLLASNCAWRSRSRTASPATRFNSASRAASSRIARSGDGGGSTDAAHTFIGEAFTGDCSLPTAALALLRP